MSSDNRDPLSGQDPLAEGPWSHLPPADSPPAPPPAESPLAPPRDATPRTPHDAPPSPWDTPAGAPTTRAGRDNAWNARQRAKRPKRDRPKRQRPPREPREPRVRAPRNPDAPRIHQRVQTTPFTGGCFFMGLLTIVLSLAVVLTIAYVGMWISGVIGFSSAIRGAACTVPAVWICATAMTEKLPISLAGRIVRMIVALLLVLGSFVVAAL